jgi:O-antigen ligase
MSKTPEISAATLRWAITPAVYSLALFYAFYSGNAILKSIILLLPGVLAAAYAAFFRRSLLMPVLIFTVPLSMMINIGGGLVINMPSEVLIAVIGLLFFGRSLYRPTFSRKILLHPLVILVSIELCWMLICASFSDFSAIGFKRSVVRGGYILVFFVLAAHWFVKPERTMLLWLLYGAGLVIPVTHTFISHAEFSFSSSAAYWIYGACLAFVLPGLFILLANQKEFRLPRWKWGAVAALFVLILLAEIFSFSRAAWMSLLGVLVLALLIRVRVRLWMLMLLFSSLAAGMWLQRETIIDRISTNESVSAKGSITEHFQSVTNVQTDASNLERINRWASAIYMAKERPVTGFGPGSYQFVYGSYQVRKYMTRISTFAGNKGHAHSEFFTALSENGFPGLILYVTILFTALGYGLKVIYHSRNAVARKITLAAVLGLTTFYIHGTFNAFLDTDKMAVLVFGAMAVIVSCYVKEFGSAGVSFRKEKLHEANKEPGKPEQQC